MSRIDAGEAALSAAVAAAAFLVCALATRALIPILRRRAVLDVPNARSSHAAPTPRGGGIALNGTLFLAWAALAASGRAPPEVVVALAGAVLLAAVSWIDDLRGLSPALRLAAQAVAVAVGVTALAEAGAFARAGPAPAVLLPASGLAWLWFVNLFNFMDGIDGLAGSEAAAIGAGLLLFAGLGAGTDPALAPAAAAVVGAAGGFLVWNWAPARIFLGDVGSVPLGYLLGFLLLGVAASGHWKIALILPLYFLVDATITLFRRLLRGERIWQAHRRHFYQQAVRGGLGHAAVARRVIAADLLLIGCGWAAENGAGWAALAAAVVIVAALLRALARSR